MFVIRAVHAAHAALVVSALGLAACAADADPSAPDVASAEDALAAKADDHWFYGGPLPALESPSATVSQKR